MGSTYYLTPNRPILLPWWNLSANADLTEIEVIEVCHFLINGWGLHEFGDDIPNLFDASDTFVQIYCRKVRGRGKSKLHMYQPGTQ